ncbi:MAG TPA: LysM peptidoglycan-binding domain-containing protein, partial [Pseudoduganella sp.]
MEIYTVRKRDTLWRISREKGVPIADIAHANNLVGKRIHDIREGQKLFIPGKGSPLPDTKLTLNFRGLDFKQITPKKIRVEHDGRVETHLQSSSNLLTLFIHDHARGLKVWIENLEKKMEPVLERTVLPIGNWTINIDSRAVKAEGALQSKKGPQAS